MLVLNSWMSKIDNSIHDIIFITLLTYTQKKEN